VQASGKCGRAGKLSLNILQLRNYTNFLKYEIRILELWLFGK
jgi:hypothetical protein